MITIIVYWPGRAVFWQRGIDIYIYIFYIIIIVIIWDVANFIYFCLFSATYNWPAMGQIPAS